MSPEKHYRLVAADGAEVLSSTPGELGGHSRTRVYGRLDCPVALSLVRRGFDVRPTRVFFADERTAIAAGYRPCGACMREEYRRWKASGAYVHDDMVHNEMHRAGGAFVRLPD